MKGKIKKIIAVSLLSTTALTAVGCGTTGNKVAKNIDKSMADFVSSINNLDYVESGKPVSDKIGKLVETSASAYAKPERTVVNENNQIRFLNENLPEAEIENTITKPADRQGDFKLFVLSESPYISLTSNDNNATLSLNVEFSTNKIEKTSSEIDEKINKLILKRSILMIYVNEIYNGNVELSDENKTAINAYVNVIKENASFLNGNRGMVKNQLKLASNLVEKQSNGNLVNYYIIKSSEALETRASKIDSTISAIDAITKIIEDNLKDSSPYKSSKLSSAYENLVSNITSKTDDKSNNNFVNTEIAKSISESLNFFENNKQNLEDNNTNNPNSGIMLLPEFDSNSINENKQPIMSTYPAIKDNNNMQNNTLTNNQNNTENKVIQPRNNNLNKNNIGKRFNFKKVQNINNINVNNAQNNPNLQILRNNNQNNNILNKTNPNTQNKAENNNLNKRTISFMQHVPNNDEIKTIRAERTPERVQKEEYASVAAGSDENIVAEHVPFKSPSKTRM